MKCWYINSVDIKLSDQIIHKFTEEASKDKARNIFRVLDTCYQITAEKDGTCKHT